MHIWVDADACPKVIRDILFRAAERTRTPLTMVANHPLPLPGSPLIKQLQVPKGFDVADDEIVARIQPGEILITADIPLAAEALAKDARVLSPRGERYDKGTIRAKLTMRDFMDTLRSSGVHTGGPPTLSPADRQTFANQLDQLLR
ncbi:YaiI/YqxD family protein [uncultured Oceanisphaera sp.]|uniref:YaiI/YqxD family protein n=1 Tax=uncultured Oceanisphaera sp. TaxID=353858 RepID=UPI002602643C|nr:YaiI/YqxD family protein [uncultured Oceanisphaera sp.]